MLTWVYSIILICIDNVCICVGLYANPSSIHMSKCTFKSAYTTSVMNYQQTDSSSHEEELTPFILSSNTISQSSPSSSPSYFYTLNVMYLKLFLSSR